MTNRTSIRALPDQPVVDDGRVVACIDAGGSHTRMRAARAGAVIHRGLGGPANPTAVDAALLRRSFADAVEGCPAPDRLLAAVAGAGSAHTQAQIRELLNGFFPDCRITVVPDWIGAFWSCAPGTEVCVLAGTGSAVISAGPDGVGWELSGGRGWLLGDAGSGADLGRALLSSYVDDPEAWSDQLAARLDRLYGVHEWRGLVGSLQASPSPARDLAVAAPLLTELAEAGNQLAVELLEARMDELARIMARHLTRHVGSDRPTVGLVGGVWSSSAARSAFLRCLDRHAGGAFALADDGVEPIERLLRWVLVTA